MIKKGIILAGGTGSRMSPITKSVNNGIETLPVTFYPMEVKEQFSEWPEKIKRQRHWALLRDVAKIASREDYLNVLNNFKEVMPWVLK